MRNLLIVTVLTVLQAGASAYAQGKKPLPSPNSRHTRDLTASSGLWPEPKPKVRWFGTLLSPAAPTKDFAQGFEIKYPGVKVETYRGTSTDIMTRLTAEAQAKQILAELEYGSPMKPVGFKQWYPEAGMSMAQYDKAMERWDKMLREIARK